MRINEAKECIKELYQNTMTVTALISERGVGKTSAYKQCAEELDIEYIALYAAALEGPDFMGLPAKDLEKGITRYLAPQFLPTKAAIQSGIYGDKGILVLEEINRVPSDTVSVLYPLLLENKINGHELGEGWRIGVTMNPDTMNYLVNSLDDAMLDRFISITVEPFIDDYLEYSREHNGNQEVLAFLTAHPDMLLVTNKSTESTVMTKSPTPRGWTKVQDIMNQTTLPEKLLIELITGVVGPIAAAAFIGFRRDQSIEVPSSRGVVTNYKAQRDRVLKLVQDRQIPVLTKVIEKVVNLLEPKKVMVKEVDGFIEDLPAELQVYAYKVISRDKPELLDFYIEHSRVFAVVSGMMLDVMLS